MRVAILFAFTFFISALTFFAIASSSEESPATMSPQFVTQSSADGNQKLLTEFIATLDPEVMKACAARHDTGGKIDLDYLSTCGDFELYARYMQISKYQAVKKFEYVMLHSSSRLEFEERLAR